MSRPIDMKLVLKLLGVSILYETVDWHDLSFRLHDPNSGRNWKISMWRLSGICQSWNIFRERQIVDALVETQP